MERNKRINVYGYVYNNTPDGIVALSQQIYDEGLGVTQDVLNREIPLLFDGFVEVDIADIHTEFPTVIVVGIYYNKISKTFIAKGEDDQYYSKWSTWGAYMKNVFLIDDRRFYYSCGKIYTISNIYNEITLKIESIISPIGEEEIDDINNRLDELEDTSVKKITVSGVTKTPDENGNVTITVDATLSNSSKNPVQNKVIKGELDKTVKFHETGGTKLVDSDYKVTADNVLDPQTGVKVLNKVQEMIEDYHNNHLPSPSPGSGNTIAYPRFEIDPETMHLYMEIVSDADQNIITLGEDGHLYYNVQI